MLRGVSEKEAMRKGAFSKPSPDSVSKVSLLVARVCDCRYKAKTRE